jgi:predicted O-methyltransferase YrrM
MSQSPLHDPTIQRVLARVRAEIPARPGGDGRGIAKDPQAFAAFGYPIGADQGDLLYLLCRAVKARRVAECATSFGVSTLYLAAAVRDNGGGLVIGSEIVASKAERARRTLGEAGLEHLVEIRIGDARETWADLGGPVDFLLVDAWPTASVPSLARAIVGLAAPQLRPGAIVVNDNGEDDYLAYVRDPENGFLSTSLPLKGGTEVSVRV